MSMTAIEFERLHKRYPGDVVAVDDVSFRVESGQIFGFLGPNGAGKSTTIKILTTLALVHQPQVLFLDEPTKGLDPSSSRDVWSEVKRLNQNLGMTIFLTTQYLDEADELADVVAIIDEGRIVSEGSPARLKAEVGSESINLAFESREEARQAQAELGDIGGQIHADRDVLRLYMDNAAQAIPAVVNRLQQAQLQPISLTLTQPTLDDVFLQVTGQRLQSTLPVSEQAN